MEAYIYKHRIFTEDVGTKEEPLRTVSIVKVKNKKNGTLITSWVTTTGPEFSDQQLVNVGDFLVSYVVTLRSYEGYGGVTVVQRKENRLATKRTHEHFLK